MRALILLCLALAPYSVQAGCDALGGYSDKTLVVDISSNDCTTDLLISFGPRAADGSIDEARRKRFRFEDECTARASKDGYAFGSFACRRGGSTPLAGATYRRSVVGSTRQMCGGGGEPEWEDVQPKVVYRCVKGCGKGAPALIDGAVAPCD